MIQPVLWFFGFAAVIALLSNTGINSRIGVAGRRLLLVSVSASPLPLIYRINPKPPSTESTHSLCCTYCYPLRYLCYGCGWLHKREMHPELLWPVSYSAARHRPVPVSRNPYTSKYSRGRCLLPIHFCSLARSFCRWIVVSFV